MTGNTVITSADSAGRHAHQGDRYWQGPGRGFRQGPVLRTGGARPGSAFPRHVPLGGSPKARSAPSPRGVDKPDSRDVCFIADDDTKDFLARHLGWCRAGSPANRAPPTGSTRARTPLPSASPAASGSAVRKTLAEGYASPNLWRFNSGGRVDSVHDPVYKFITATTRTSDSPRRGRA
jgi:hypothetical protein